MGLALNMLRRGGADKYADMSESEGLESRT
jgi:hypothetical protein